MMKKANKEDMERIIEEFREMIDNFIDHSRELGVELQVIYSITTFIGNEVDEIDGYSGTNSDYEGAKIMLEDCLVPLVDDLKINEGNIH